MEWISVDERLPEDGEHILGARLTNREDWYIRGGYYRLKAGWESWISHWRPIEPPYPPLMTARPERPYRYDESTSPEKRVILDEISRIQEDSKHILVYDPESDSMKYRHQIKEP